MLPLPPSDPSSPDKYLRDFEPEESRSEHSRRPISRIGENSTDWKKRKEGKKEEEETKITRTVFVPYARVVTRLGRVYVTFRHLESFESSDFIYWNFIWNVKWR